MLPLTSPNRTNFRVWPKLSKASIPMAELNCQQTSMERMEHLPSILSTSQFKSLYIIGQLSNCLQYNLRSRIRGTYYIRREWSTLFFVISPLRFLTKRKAVCSTHRTALLTERSYSSSGPWVSNPSMSLCRTPLCRLRFPWICKQWSVSIWKHLMQSWIGDCTARVMFKLRHV